jgi:hypothetical protein
LFHILRHIQVVNHHLKRAQQQINYINQCKFNINYNNANCVAI